MTDQGNARRALAFFVSKGSKLVGGAVGASLAQVMGGDPLMVALGGAGGVAVTEAMEHVSTELVQRVMGEREVVRVGAAMAFAIEKYNQNIEQGRTFRRDGFFATTPDERASAEEVLEGVLLAAQREHEEKKVRYLGYLYANIATTPSVDRGYANLLIQLAESLSWRQLCLIKLFKEDPTPYIHGRGRFDSLGLPSRADGLTALTHDFYELDQRGLVSQHEIDPRFMDYFSERFGPVHKKASIGRIAKPRAMGDYLYDLMSLCDIPDAELEPIKEILPQYRLTEDEVFEWSRTAPPPKPARA